MNRKSASLYLESSVALLVEHFGVSRVRAALDKVSTSSVAEAKQTRRQSRKTDRPARPSVTSMLVRVRQEDQEKHRLLTAFFKRLRDKVVLPESQDIRQFAQIIGLKDIDGKSRKDMLPRLMRFLLEQPTERLTGDIKAAANVSEQQRKQGFSILADKLLLEP